MNIEDRPNGIKFVESGNIQELTQAVHDLTKQGYEPSLKNEYIASGIFGYYTIGMVKVGDIETPEEVVPDVDAAPPLVETPDETPETEEGETQNDEQRVKPKRQTRKKANN